MWVVRCRAANAINANAEMYSKADWDYLHMNIVCNSLSLITDHAYEYMSDHLRSILKQQPDLALLWIDAKQKLLKWEHSEEMVKQKVASRTTYQLWKRSHKKKNLCSIRDSLYAPLCNGTWPKDHESAIEEGELELDIFYPSDDEMDRESGKAPRPYLEPNNPERV